MLNSTSITYQMKREILNFYAKLLGTFPNLNENSPPT